MYQILVTTLLIVHFSGQGQLTHWIEDKIKKIYKHFQMHFCEKNECIMNEISLKDILKGQIYSKSAFVWVMAWHLFGAMS